MSDNYTPMDDEAVIPISALEHYSYCPRQCALIHVEQTFEENVYTVRGQLAHVHVDAGGDRVARGLTAVRSLPLWSERLALRGKADLVEMRADGPYPVEYKVGRRHGRHADLQLCAQALCLEEMLGATVSRGAIYYHRMRRRHEVEFDASLRQDTEAAAAAVLRMLSDQRLPPAPNDARCPNCSLIDACLPGVVGERARVRAMDSVLFRPLASGSVDGAGAEEGPDA
jgi:CRISPR-associated exonuclease Cas4